MTAIQLAQVNPTTLFRGMGPGDELVIADGSQQVA